jgi:hypothetical protein
VSRNDIPRVRSDVLGNPHFNTSGVLDSKDTGYPGVSIARLIGYGSDVGVIASQSIYEYDNGVTNCIGIAKSRGR